MKASVILLAAGKGSRFGSSSPKQFYLLGGKPVLAHSLETFGRCAEISEIVLVTAEEDVDYAGEIADAYGFGKVTRVVPGGKERQDSVRNGLHFVSPNADVVLIHDAARPFVAPEDVKKLIKLTKFHGCCVLGVRAKDTVKICDANNGVVSAPDRDFVWLMQTPQAFWSDVIIKAHEKAEAENFYGTDDAMLTERLGYKTLVVEGSYDNFKITTSADIALAEAVLRRRAEEIAPCSKT